MCKVEAVVGVQLADVPQRFVVVYESGVPVIVPTDCPKRNQCHIVSRALTLY
jgi:hypothetical protein